MSTPKTILVTGSEGFIGKALAKRIADLKLPIRIVPFSSSVGRDVTKKESFANLSNEGITHVIHLAGKTFVPESWEKPADFYQVNTMGTANVLEFCRAAKTPLLYFSSYIYGTPQYLPIDEKHPIVPNTPYGHSKWLGEELCRFYSEQFSVPVSVIRPFNIYGPGQNEQFLISKIIHQCIRDRAISIHDTTPKRDFLYIDDLVDACLGLLDSTEKFGVYNVGFGRSHSVMEIVEAILKISPEKVSFESSGVARPNEVMDVVASCRLTREGKWSPKIDLAEGLKRVYENLRSEK